MLEILLDTVIDNLKIFPFLLITYLFLEYAEHKSGDKLSSAIRRAGKFGPLIGSLCGILPQCGFSAAAASFYAGGAVTAGTLIAVFLSTSDELIPVLISEKAPLSLICRILAVKVVSGVAVGFAVNAVLSLFGKGEPKLHVDELCAHSRCSCKKRNGVLVPALVHTVEIFLFILVISGAVELILHFVGEDGLRHLILNEPWWGEALAGLIGLVPNCAVSVSGAQIFLKGGMSASALMALSLTGSGVGMLVLFRTSRRWKENIAILLCVYLAGVLMGHFTGFLIG